MPFSILTSSMHSALVKPPFWKSEELSLIPIGNPAPTASRTAARTDIRRRARFSRGTAPFVLTPVRQRAEELRDQIAMRGVQCDAGEACHVDLPRREAELANGALDLRFRYRPRFREIEAGAAHDIDFDHRGRKRRRVDGSVDLAAGMAELGPELCAAGTPDSGQPRKLFVAAFVMDDDVQRPFQMNGIDLDITREQQSGAGHRPLPV